MMRKLTAMLAVLAAVLLAGWGAGSATAAPAKIYIGGGSGILVPVSYTHLRAHET